MHSKQGWKEVLDDGQRREVRAVRKEGTWKIQSRLKGEKEWVYHDPPPLRDLEYLHDMLTRKYQRRRCSEKDVATVKAMIEKRLRA